MPPGGRRIYERPDQPTNEKNLKRKTVRLMQLCKKLNATETR